MTRFSSFFLFVTLTVMVGVLCFIGGRTYEREKATQNVQIDTVVQVVHHYREGSSARTSRVLVDVPRIILLPFDTTIVFRQGDSTFVQVPEETVLVEDSLYTAQLSGIHPRLDWVDIHVTERTVTVTKTLPAPRWGFSVTAGPGLVCTPQGKVYGGLGVCVGVSYKF